MALGVCREKSQKRQIQPPLAYGPVNLLAVPQLPVKGLPKKHIEWVHSNCPRWAGAIWMLAATWLPCDSGLCQLSGPVYLCPRAAGPLAVSLFIDIWIQGERSEHLLSAMFVPVNLLNEVLLLPVFYREGKQISQWVRPFARDHTSVESCIEKGQPLLICQIPRTRTILFYFLLLAPP